MNKPIIEKQADGTIKITITLPTKDVEEAKKEVVAELSKTAKLAGFRKGKAPEAMVAGALNQEQVREETLKKLLPNAYAQAIQQNNLKPIMNPKIHIEKIEDDKDWEFVALTCEMPEVDLSDYKKGVKDITAKSKIIIPGKEQQKPSMEDIMKAVLETAKIQIPEILVEQEVDRLLSQLLNDIKRLGLSLDQYLASTKRNPEDLRKEYAQRAEQDIKVEFALQKIAETEKITIENQEIEEAINKAKDPNERQSLEANRYVLASILRQQKTLDFLINL
jgi:FKBP-type peptidyl-prolyl cis-trans isomerase (trigger factor)